MATTFIAYDPSIIQRARQRANRSRESKLLETACNPKTQGFLSQTLSPAQSCGTPDVQKSWLAPGAAVNIEPILSKGVLIAGDTEARDKAAEPDIASQSACKPRVLYEKTAVEYTRINRNSGTLLEIFASKGDPTLLT